MEKSDPLKLKAIRKEIQEIKDRINLLEATLDINSWKETRSQTSDAEQTNDKRDLKFTFKSDGQISSSPDDNN